MTIIFEQVFKDIGFFFNRAEFLFRPSFFLPADLISKKIMPALIKTIPHHLRIPGFAGSPYYCLTLIKYHFG